MASSTKSHGHLTVKNFKVVWKTIWETRSKWYNIGIELGREPDELEATAMKHNSDPEECFREVILSWLRGDNPKPTWLLLANALRAQSVGFGQLAKEIEPMSYSDDYVNILEEDRLSNAVVLDCHHSGPGQEERIVQMGDDQEKKVEDELNDPVFHCPCQRCTLESYLDIGCPLSRQNSFPFLDLSILNDDSKEDIIQKLSNDTESIKKNFAKLFNNTCKSLSEQGIPTQEVARCALSLDAYESASKNKPLLSECADELRNAKTIDDLFIVLKPYMSFFNFEVLECIIENLGSDENKAKFEEYCTKFDEFCRRKVFEVPPNSFSEPSALQCKRTVFAVLVTELDGEPMTDLSVIKRSKRKIATLLGLKSSTLHLHSIDQGSLLLVLSVPNFIANEIFPLDPYIKKLLIAEGFTVYIASSSKSKLANVKQMNSLSLPNAQFIATGKVQHTHFMQQLQSDEIQATLQAELADVADGTTIKLSSENSCSKEDPAEAKCQNRPSLERILTAITVPDSQVDKMQDSWEVDDNLQIKVSDCMDIFTLFKNMDLTRYYPQKFSLQKALCVRRDTLSEEKCHVPKHLTFFILHKIMSYDYHCRAVLLHLSEPHSNDSDNDDLSDDSNSTSSWTSAQEHVSVRVHPMDGLLAILHCADDFLRQDLMARLATCQLAIPLLLPDPFTKQLTLPIWAMKSIVKEWKSTLSGCEGVYEGPVTSFKTPLVSFLRLNEQRRSKSNTMNEVINESKYEHFYHRNMEGGSYKHLLGDGVVDICWYLPVGRPTDTFPDAVTFLNLHGDARDHPQQLTFLSQISIACFVFLSEEDIDDKNVGTNGQEVLSGAEVLKTLANTPGGIVLLTDRVLKGGKIDQTKRNISRKMHFIKMEGKNDDDVKKAIRARVKKILQDTWAKQRSEMIAIDSRECVELARTLKINVDVDKKELKEGKILSNSLIKIVTSHKDQMISSKEALLPLQGKRLWLKWASLDKEEHRQVNRGGEKFDRYRIRKYSEKKHVRELQLHHVCNLTPLMEHFIVFILTSSRKVRDYFLQCVKLSLNNLSREEISKLQLSYKERRDELLKLQTMKEMNQGPIKKCKMKIEELHEQMVNASLGLEHLLRELGQVYEATQELTCGINEQFSQLPRVAAEILCSGYPLEIMDGDAAHVPTKWIEAVLNEVGKLLQDPNVFVLTVLGLQSTGKSTLMNTAFGLQFNVGAGRCTRGAFMQLLSINKELRKQIKCDFILIIDTEGLRAPELDTLMTQKHDNELATFVIGLADVTLINISGEAPGDMDDILQTSVHAFIRMTSVNLSPSCQFIHQNVGTVLAKDKGNLGRSRFKDRLDSMTRAAAKEENCEGQYEYFHEVIEFADQTDVHQFPGLWRGDPPMAPVNPGYSDRAQQLVMHLIQLIERKNEKGSTHLTTFKTRMKGLWNALLSENFVFSFKNTMEITVYNSFEAQYIQWSWSFKRQMIEWQQTAENKIKSMRDKNGLLAMQKSLLNELSEVVQRIYEEIQAKLIKYFEDHRQREVLAQWQRVAQNKLKRLAQDEEYRVKGLCVQWSGAQRARVEVGDLNKTYRERMLANLKEVVNSMEEEIKQRLAEQEKSLGPNVDEEQMRIVKEDLKEKELRDAFRRLWEEWIQEIEQTLPPQHDNIDVEADAHKALTEFFPSHDTIVIKELKSRTLHEWGKSLTLPILSQYLAFKRKSRIQTLKGFGRSLIGRTDLSEPDRRHAEYITSNLFEIAKDFLRARRNEKYNAIFFQDLMQILSGAIDDHTAQERCEFNLTPDYRIAVCIIACGFAMKQFQDAVEAMRKQNDPISYLEQELREPLYSIFKNKYNHTTQDKATAATFCELLAEPIRRQIKNTLGPVVVTDIVATNLYLRTKVDLVTTILIEMGDQVEQSGELKDYFIYLLDSKHSLKQWITRYTIQHCEQGGEDGETKLVLLGKCELTSLIEFIRRKLQEVGRKLNCVENAINLETWLNEVCNLETLEGQLQLNLETFDALTNEVDELKDLSNFTEEVQAGLSRLCADLSKEIKQYTPEDMDTWQTRPYDVLFDQLCGCCEECPFCKEQCDYLTEGHEVAHHVKYHRPVCLGGYHDSDTREMVPEVCSYLVTSEVKFKNHDTSGNYHPFKKYRDFYPKWKITPEKSMQAELYWKWFLGQYADKVAKYFGVKSNEIPKEWKTEFKWKDVRRELLNK